MEIREGLLVVENQRDADLVMEHLVRHDSRANKDRAVEVAPSEEAAAFKDEFADNGFPMPLNEHESVIVLRGLAESHRCHTDTSGFHEATAEVFVKLADKIDARFAAVQS